MKNFFKIFFAISFMLQLSLFANEYHFEKLNKNVYIMYGPLEEPNAKNKGFMNNPVAIISNNGVIVVDPGGSLIAGKMVLKELKKISNKPVIAVFNTHIHGDHWLGNGAIKAKYPKAVIYANPLMITLAKNGEGQKWVTIMNKLTNNVTKNTKAVYPTKSVVNLQKLQIDDQSFVIHHPKTPAHTKTDIIIEHVNSGTMIMGDLALVNRLGGFRGSSSIYGNIDILKYALKQKMNTYIPGHGQAGNAKIAILPYLNYLMQLESITKEGYRNELEDYQIKKIAIKKLDKYKKWHGFWANVGNHIIKMYAEIEDRDI